MLRNTTNVLISSILLSLLSACGGSSGSSSEDVAATPSILSPPTDKAQQIVFTDTDISEGELGGDVVIGRAINEEDIESYLIRWGAADGCTLAGSSLISSVPANGEDLVFSLSDNTAIPTDAVSIVVYSSNSTGEMQDCDNTATDIIDLVAVEDSDNGTSQITVISYNTGFASGSSENTRAQLINLVLEQSADIVGFQELGINGRADIEEGLLEDYDFYYDNNSANSNPIAVMKGIYTFLEQGAIGLTVENCTASYMMTFVRLATSTGEEFLILNDHFCRANPSNHAIQFMSAIADLYPGLPKIFAGDLNSSETSDVINYLLNQGDLESQSSAVVFYDSWGLLDTGLSKAEAGAPIDWVLLDNPQTMKVIAKSVINDSELSDHDPVSATFEFISDDRNLFAVPKVLAGNLVDGKRVYELSMQNGQTEFTDGKFTDTMGYNGSFFGPTILMHKNEEVILNVANSLVKITDNNRALETTTHWHGFHIPAKMDGGPHQIIAPNTTWSPTFTVLNRAGMYWYHPHIMTEGGEDRTSGTSWQVWQGLAGQIIVKDDVSETLAIPKTFGIDDIPLTIQDRQFDDEGQFREPPFDDLGYVWTMRKGTTVLVNGKITPLLQSYAQVIRLRLHNGSNARTFNFGFDDDRVFYQIATDGGFLEKPVAMNRLLLGNAERAEILVDFSADLGSEVVLKSFASELGDIYVPEGLNDEHDRIDYEILTINIGATTENAVLTIVEDLVTIDRPVESSAVNAASPRVFAMNGRDMAINDKKMDMSRIDETITLGDIEIWEITNSSDDREQAHPFHIHGDSFYILSREYNGEISQPPENERGWKDVVLVRPGEKVKIIKSFLDFSDDEFPYMYHCHILKHEDSGMMGQWLVVDP